VIFLLSGILLAFIVLIVILLTGRQQDSPSPERPITSGETVNRSELFNSPVPPKFIGDEKRIKEVAQEKKTYVHLAKGGFDARVEDKDWATRKVVNLAYAYEMSGSRMIESNDGKKIVEIRQFDSVRTVKLLSEVESVTIDLGAPSQLVLGIVLDWAGGSGTGEAILAAKPIAEKILREGAQYIADNNTKAFGEIDSLSGKKIRVTFVDGEGVVAIEPIGCSLNADERDFAFNTATLLDYHALPNIEFKPGETWTIDGGELGGMLDPSLRGASHGEIVVAREPDFDEGGKQYAKLTIKKGFLNIDSSDASQRRIGSFTPRGFLKYNIVDRYVESAELTGDMHFETVSKDHLLFEASFKTRPRLQVQYSCKIQ
jgi:hypothetical protein